MFAFSFFFLQTTKAADITTMIALATCSDNVFALLVEALETFESGGTKNQKLKAKQIADIKVYIFRKFVSIHDSAKVHLLRELITGDISTADFAEECIILNKLSKVQSIFIDYCGCTTWEEAVERFPTETTREALLPFTNMKLTPVPDALKSFCRRAGQEPVATIGAAMFKGEGETLGVVALQDPKEFDMAALSKHYKDVCGFALAVLSMPKVCRIQRISHA